MGLRRFRILQASRFLLSPGLDQNVQELRPDQATAPPVRRHRVEQHAGHLLGIRPLAAHDEHLDDIRKQIRMRFLVAHVRFRLVPSRLCLSRHEKEERTVDDAPLVTGWSAP